MEIHKNNITLTDKPELSDGPFKYFEKARKFTFDNYSDEVVRISSTNFKEVESRTFFHEYMWTVHTTGFSAKAVGKFFPRLVEAYNSIELLAYESEEETLDRVLKVCNNRQKAIAVKKMATLIRDKVDLMGWQTFRDTELCTPELLTKLPYIGKITCFHLARNIGLLDSVKPDLHLIRMARFWGFQDCIEMCKSIQSENPDLPLGIIDLVLWYGASTFGTIEIKADGDR